jgi:hypothetical protein
MQVHPARLKEVILSTQTPTKEKLLLLQTVQWTKLQQIEDLEPIGERDCEVLEEIRQVLLRRGYQNRFASACFTSTSICSPARLFLEQSDESARISTIMVVPETVARDAMETAWRFSSGDDIRAGRNCQVRCQGFGQTGHSSQHQCVGPR